MNVLYIIIQEIGRKMRISDGELFQNMNTRVPNEPILLPTHEFEKLSIHLNR